VHNTTDRGGDLASFRIHYQMCSLHGVSIPLMTA
jgi:hypothetical protein